VLLLPALPSDFGAGWRKGWKLELESDGGGGCGSPRNGSGTTTMQTRPCPGGCGGVVVAALSVVERAERLRLGRW